MKDFERLSINAWKNVRNVYYKRIDNENISWGEHGKHESVATFV